jgi:hypothetical protein
MPVVINELEVVVASPPSPQGSGSQAQPAAGGAPPLSPIEMNELLERRVRQEFRLFAH